MFAFVAIGVIAGILVIVTLIGQARSLRERALLRFWTSVQLPLVTGDTELTANVARYLRLRDLSMTVAGIIGLGLTLAVLLLTPEYSSPDYIWLIALPVVIVAMSGAEVVFSLRSSPFHPSTDSRRFARTRATSITDYVHRGRLLIAPVLLGAALLVFVTGIVLAGAGVVSIPTLRGGAVGMLIVVALAVFLFGTLAERWILRAAQPAADGIELAWSDAFRSETLRSLGTFRSVIAWVTLIASGSVILVGFGSVDIGTTLPALVNFGLIVIVGIYNRPRARDYFRRQLWPNIAELWPPDDSAEQSELNSPRDPAALRREG